MLLGIFCPNGISAQNDLTAEDKEQLQERVKFKVEEFQQYLSDIVNTKLSTTQRKSSIAAALGLFIGKGNAYYVINEYNERENRNPVRIQISSVNNSNVKWQKTKDYLNNQYNNVLKYEKVVITDADVVRVDNIYKVGEGKYQAVAYFAQKYMAYRDGRLSYGDITSKKVIVYIDAIETPVGYVWDAKFGDIYVTSTEKAH